MQRQHDVSPTEAELMESGPRRWGALFAAVWMFYLLQPIEAGWDRGDLRGWIAIVAVIAFAVLYLGCFVVLRSRRPVGGPFRMTVRPVVAAGLVAAEIVLGVITAACVGQTATSMAVYVAVTAMLCLGSLWGWVTVVVVAAVAYGAGTVLPGWHSESGLLAGIFVAALAIWGIGQAINRNVALLSVREENVRLELADARNRFARDLHDILGHSLTVITVKAELAQRLLDHDLERTRAELADLERLSRDALADVRRAVEGYREITLPGEIARARNALRTAEIRAVLPNSTDDVPTDLRELFAWTVREGVTNVIRHSAASTCTVRLTPTSAEVRDDGRGADAPGGIGHGLVGLRERAEAVGATVTAGPVDGGFSLKVTRA
ncbi:MAG TPA: sensor histidine kinase [Nocardioides sp.]|nr:sensor histidine kinase [Nocardioides sp.]